MQLDPNDLLLFARVVGEGSFSKAALQLSVPVSTVSRRITALETALGERLLLRTTRKLTVTELGEALLEHARQVQESAEAAGALADSRKLEPGGRLRITMATDLGLIAPFLAEFLASYPAISVEVDVSARFVDLIGENVDVALRIGPLKDDVTLAAYRPPCRQGMCRAATAPSRQRRRAWPSPRRIYPARAGALTRPRATSATQVHPGWT